MSIFTRTPEQEAAKQLEIKTHLANQQYQRELAETARIAQVTAENAQKRQQMWAAQQQEVEDRRMAEMAKVNAAEADKRERQRQTEIERNKVATAELRIRQSESGNIARAIGELADPNADLSSPAACIRAAENHAKIVALREMAEAAEVRLIAAELATGLHRT
jgi:hypothetical protein